MQKIVVCIASTLLGLIGSLGFAESFPPDQEKQIRTVIEDHYTFWNKHDPAKMAELYAFDGDLRTIFNERANNRKEVEKIFADEQNTKMKDAQIKYEIQSIKMIKPNIAFIDVESDIKGIETLDQKKYMPIHHHVVYVLVLRDGKWQILIGRPF